MRNSLLIVISLLLITSITNADEYINVTGVMDNMLIINDKILHVGEFYNDKEILSISQNEVVVRDKKGDNQTLYITFDGSKVTRNKEKQPYQGLDFSKLFGPENTQTQVVKQTTAQSQPKEKKLITQLRKAEQEQDPNKALILAQDAYAYCFETGDIAMVDKAVALKRARLDTYNQTQDNIRTIQNSGSRNTTSTTVKKDKLPTKPTLGNTGESAKMQVARYDSVNTKKEMDKQWQEAVNAQGGLINIDGVGNGVGVK